MTLAIFLIADAIVSAYLLARWAVRRRRYYRWRLQGMRIRYDFALWHERRLELDRRIATWDVLTEYQRDVVRSDIAYYMRWADEIQARHAAWEQELVP